MSNQQIDQIVKVIKQRFISPFKIIYLIDQKQADYFKQRNKNQGCCTASEITIKFSEQTKIEKYLSQLITTPALKYMLNQILQYCEDRFKNIIEKGKQDGLKISQNVQKYLIDSVMSQSINKIIHKKLIQRLSQQGQVLSSDIGLWATPDTWYKKYPNVALQLFEPKNLSELFNSGLTIIQKMKHLQHSIFNELQFLEKDGNFQQVQNKQLEQQNKNTQVKILRNIPYQANNDSNDSSQNYLGRLKIMLQSIPFQLNLKANRYLTISDAVQVHYHKLSIIQALRQCAYQIIVPIGADIQIELNPQSSFILNKGCILVILPSMVEKINIKQHQPIFVLRSCINQVKKVSN